MYMYWIIIYFRLNCDSPVNEFETRTPKGRAKRSRGSATSTPVNDKSLEGRKLRKNRKGSTFQAPPSPAKSETCISSGGVKRKGRPTDIDLNSSGSKRIRPSVQIPTPGQSESPITASTSFIECPEPNCNKKYKHQNGLKYHQTHAHQLSSGVLSGIDDNEDDTRDTCDNLDEDEDDAESTTADQSDATGENSNSGSVTKSSTKIASSSVPIVEESTSKSAFDTDDTPLNNQEPVTMETDNIEPVSVTSNTKDSVSTKTNISVQSVAKVIAKPITTLPSGNAFQIVSSQHQQPVSSQPQSSLTTLGLISQSQVVPLGVQTISLNTPATPVQTAIPIQVTTIPTLITQPDIRPDLATKTEKLIRPKVSQPILPTPITTLAPTASSVSQGNMPVSSASTSQVTQLKPIQPKPILPGEQTSAIHPTLLAFKDSKDKKAKQKKKDKLLPKDGPVVAITPTSVMPSNITSSVMPSNITSSVMPSMTSSVLPSGMTSSQGQTKTSIVEPMKQNEHQSTGVIKVVPMVAKPLMSGDIRKKEGNIVTIPRQERPMERLDKPLSLPLSGANVGVVTAQVQPSPKGVDLSQPSSRPVDLPNVLKVNSNLSCLDSKSNINENVQSPSYYSDISEESGSPAQQPQSASPHKKDDGPNQKSRDSAIASTNIPGPSVMDGANLNSYNMYGNYYGQNPYVLPPTNITSPNSHNAIQNMSTNPHSGPHKHQGMQGMYCFLSAIP